MKKIKLRISEIKILISFLIAKCFGRFFDRHYWVMLERGYDARDNAYWMYEYMKREHPERKIYYIIDKKSADYAKVQEDAVQLGSWRSYWILMTAEKIISSHYAVGFPRILPRLFRILKLYKNFYFLQHGIISNNLFALYGDRAPMRLFICGAKPEYEYVKKNFGHPAGVVQYTGLARFDQLHQCQTRDQIVVMPTWRTYIRSETEFLQSEYYSVWQSFLSHSELTEALEKKGVKLVFYPHYEMQRYIQHFVSKSSNIVIASFGDYDVQTLLKESKLLITDYSSVFFDFAYMRKPIVYYQFDEKQFFGRHYCKGYFDYHTMGFGDVCKNENEVFKSVIHCLQNRMEIEARYLQRIEGFFPLYDQSNRKRIYEMITGEDNEE